PGAGGRERLQSAELRAMPFRTLVVRLEQALTEDTFRVVASGIPNLRGLTGGGDTTFVYVAPLAPVAPDAEPDSAGGLGPLQEEAPPVQTDSAEAPSQERPPRSGEPRSPASGDG
ncbi:MAG: hypothetical protein M8860_05990, partial [marine benthic group bacterium]|nr:hypothetical protein [Candidatus Carthagonibacter metallireducens]